MTQIFAAFKWPLLVSYYFLSIFSFCPLFLFSLMLLVIYILLDLLLIRFFNVCWGISYGHTQFVLVSLLLLLFYSYCLERDENNQ